MATHNADNERVKRRYFVFVKEAKRQSEDSVDAVAKALARFEAANRYRDFKAFRFEQAVAFKKHLAEQNSLTTGGKLSKATLNATQAHLKRFFQWLADKPGYKSRLQYSDAEYFNLSEKDRRVATARRERAAPTLQQVKHVIALMPGSRPPRPASCTVAVDRLSTTSPQRQRQRPARPITARPAPRRTTTRRYTLTLRRRLLNECLLFDDFAARASGRRAQRIRALLLLGLDRDPPPNVFGHSDAAQAATGTWRITVLIHEDDPDDAVLQTALAQIAAAESPAVAARSPGGGAVRRRRLNRRLAGPHCPDTTAALECRGQPLDRSVDRTSAADGPGVDRRRR